MAELGAERLDAGEIDRMTTPLWEQARAAYEEGDARLGGELLDKAVVATRSLQDYSINWIASLLTFVGEELDEEAVERALRRTGDDFIRPRRIQSMEWASLPASARAKLIARSMVANSGTVEVTEDDEKITLSFRCGSGGRLIEEGCYEGDHPYLTLREAAPRTFMRDEMPVYCAHCPVNNEIQPLEWGGAPTSIEYPPDAPGEPCVHHVYRDATAIPPEALRRIGRD